LISLHQIIFRDLSFGNIFDIDPALIELKLATFLNKFKSLKNSYFSKYWKYPVNTIYKI
jgi:hypothetical protein